MRRVKSNRNGKMGTVISILCLVYILSIVQLGCAEKETDPTKILISKAVKALGGEKRTRTWTTRVEKGLFETKWPGWGNLKAECSRLVKKPDKLKIDRDFSAYDHPFFQTYFYNSGDAWMIINLNTRQYPNLASDLEDYLEKVDGLSFYYTECDTVFAVEEVPDDSLITGSTVNRIGFVHEGDTVYFDLDKDSNLPVRTVTERGSQHIILDDYRKTGGMKVPFRVTVYENGEKRAEYTWETIKFNESIDDEVFDEGRPKGE